METLTLLTLILIGAWLVKSSEQRRRIALLGGQLGNYQIEKLMENLTDGYLRCLGEDAAERREQVWRLLDTTEQKLADQFQNFATEFARLPEQETRVSRLPVAIPYLQTLLPATTFDLRALFAIHARGIAAVARNERGRAPKAKAFMMSAELFLMQHSCHWYCKSRSVASARLLARHQTSHAQVLDAVSPETREAYRALTGV
ncbi:hypothetical protein QTH87_17580 [Variovorax sp. J22P168]|uniref:hypothetical protein n=1 Tax=Variovorax jilinensis TaxID=3053513 RepID=UPI002576EEAC|nr:hypothetical protein [Variovorax sp. J22P168]MDM0014254.1 hypothetical protein [Variovorax sp. J22P168]